MNNKVTLKDLLNENIPKWIYYLGGCFMYGWGIGFGSLSFFNGFFAFLFTFLSVSIFIIIELIYKNRGKK